MSMSWQVIALLTLLAVGHMLQGCTTSYVEFEGECLIQRWNFLGYGVRVRQICDLPKPQLTEPDTRVIRENEPMDPNAFPGLFDRNKADSADPNLLEKRRHEIEQERGQ